MAFDINRGTRAQGWPELRFPAAHFEWADQSFGGTVTGGLLNTSVTAATSGSGDCLVGMRHFRAIVHLKTHVVGASTTGNSYVFMDVADNATFVTNFQVIGSAVIDKFTASSTGPQTLTLYGMSGLTTRQFVRVRILSLGSENGSYDCVIDAC